MPKRIYQSVNTVIITCGLWNTLYKVYIVPGVSTACVFLTILCRKFSNCSRWSHETGLRVALEDKRPQWRRTVCYQGKAKFHMSHGGRRNIVKMLKMTPLFLSNHTLYLFFHSCLSLTNLFQHKEKKSKDAHASSIQPLYIRFLMSIPSGFPL